MARKRKPKPTGQNRNQARRSRIRRVKAVEDRRLAGGAEAVPEVVQARPLTALQPAALDGERVRPEAQSSQPFPKLIVQAIRGGWAVPDAVKPSLIDELTKVVLDDDPESPVSPVAKVMAFNALRAADQFQHEVDNPKRDSKVQINVNGDAQVAITEGEVAELLRRVAEQKRLLDGGSGG